MKKAGIMIFIVGVALTVFTTFQFFTQEKVADLGVIEVTKEKPHSLSWSPLIGIAVMGIGGVLLWKGSRK
ncbi:MAG: LPXTG cell wall anchor domain-containing protein [Paludibacter sp.]